MNTNRLIVSLSAFFCGCCYALGFTVIIFFFPDYGTSDSATIEHLIGHPTIFQVWYLCLYVLFGFSLLFLHAGMVYFYTNSLLKTLSTSLASIWVAMLLISGFIMIETIDSVVVDRNFVMSDSWKTLWLLQNILGGSIEVVGGCWTYIVTLQARRADLCTKASYLISTLVLIMGAATLIPALDMLTTAFGILQLIWFFKIGLDVK